MEIVPFRPEFESEVLDLILEIQRNKFDIPISAKQQPDLRKMFVQRAFRGSEFGTAKRLLDCLIAWCVERGVEEIFLGTTPRFLAAHRFYEKNGFEEVSESDLPPSFSVMEVDKKFYRWISTSRSIEA